MKIKKPTKSVLDELFSLSTSCIKVIAKKRQKGGKHYLCECTKCGNQFFSEAWRIKTLKSCGCKRKLDISLINEKIGFLTVVGVSKIKDSKGNSKFDCKCVCNKFVTRTGTQLREAKKTGAYPSCGCTKVRLNTSQDGYTLIYKNEYKSYQSMLKRCYNLKDVNYINYGKRGIKVCKRWRFGSNGLTGFQCFILDMGRRPFNSYSLDRIDPNVDYKVSNCRWADKFLQANNKTTNVWYKFDSGLIDLKTLSSHYKVKYVKASKFLKSNPSRDLVWYNKSILAFDPGTKNFAYAWIKNCKVAAGGMFEHTIRSITKKDLVEFTTTFSTQLDLLLDSTRPDVIVIERFMVRAFGTKLIELISLMIGIIAQKCYDRAIQFELLTSSQWKLSSKKLFELKDLYKEGKQKYNLPPHPIDAMCMARYVMSYNNFGKEDKSWLYKNLLNCRADLHKGMEP